MTTGLGPEMATQEKKTLKVVLVSENILIDSEHIRLERLSHLRFLISTENCQ